VILQSEAIIPVMLTAVEQNCHISTRIVVTSKFHISGTAYVKDNF